MPHPLRLGAYIIPLLIARPEPLILTFLHSEELEFLVGPDAAHHAVVHAADDVVALAAGEVVFVHGDLDHGVVGGRGQLIGVGLEVSARCVSQDVEGGIRR
jgi:hypothetical protein